MIDWDSSGVPGVPYESAFGTSVLRLGLSYDWRTISKLYEGSRISNYISNLASLEELSLLVRITRPTESSQMPPDIQKLASWLQDTVTPLSCRRLQRIHIRMQDLYSGQPTPVYEIFDPDNHLDHVFNRIPELRELAVQFDYVREQSAQGSHPPGPSETISMYKALLCAMPELKAKLLMLAHSRARGRGVAWQAFSIIRGTAPGQPFVHSGSPMSKSSVSRGAEADPRLLAIFYEPTFQAPVSRCFVSFFHNSHFTLVSRHSIESYDPMKRLSPGSLRYAVIQMDPVAMVAHYADATATAAAQAMRPKKYLDGGKDYTALSSCFANRILDLLVCQVTLSLASELDQGVGPPIPHKRLVPLRLPPAFYDDDDDDDDDEECLGTPDDDECDDIEDFFFLGFRGLPPVSPGENIGIVAGELDGLAPLTTLGTLQSLPELDAFEALSIF
ncbi:hypothetical protein NUW54_g9865 [Trametes sanguinea]|uniref:Uncharacterized protein n=1 Tax=Trametes sanguinea TaxID=158606 RepID=A0ACC1P4K6_9APHY|nr:hypothetical protein NUW54_g9865 [Trametes sanguinea]